MTWHQVAIALAFALFAFDFQNLVSLWRGRTLNGSWRRSSDFTILVPVYGHPRYFAERDTLRRWIKNVLVIVDEGGAGMAAFAGELEAEGWRVARVLVNSPSPPSLIRAALPQVTTSYAIRMDADTRTSEEIGRYIAAMEDDGADICSVKVLVDSPRSQAQRFQALEYRMAMLSRHYRAWLTSGACLVARTEALSRILDRHSMWFPGEDIETGRIAHALRMRVRHLDMQVTTDAPGSWLGLFKQRRLWWVGNFRHTIVNLDRNALQLPVWSFYYVALVWVGVYFKAWTLTGLVTDPMLFMRTVALLFGVYAIVTVVANVQVFSLRMLVYPPYALVQAILMPVVGMIFFLQLAHRQGYLGRYRFGYRRA